MTQPDFASDDSEVKLERLRVLMRAMESVLVCYSGGIDSTVVLAIATEQLPGRAVGMTAVSQSLPGQERQDAERIARLLGADHRWVHTLEMDRPGYRANGPDRCFHCKSELYEVAESKRQEWELRFVVNGSNIDDLGDYRPGLEAATRARVRSPLVEAEMTKTDVRAVARRLGIDAWDKPAAACLSSRIPYGSEVTQERLEQIGNFEADLRAWGFRQVRVRWHDRIARLELEVSELPRALDPDVRKNIVAAGLRHGFAYVTLDLAGYRMGSHNEVLVGRSLRVVPSE